MSNLEKVKMKKWTHILYCLLFASIVLNAVIIKNVHAFDYGDVVIKRIILPENIMPGSYFSAKLVILNKKDSNGEIKLIAKMPAFYNYENVSLKGKDITIISIVLKAPQNPTPCIFKLEDGNKTISYSEIVINPTTEFLSLHCPRIVKSKDFEINGFAIENGINNLNIYVNGKYYKTIKTNPDGTFETNIMVKNYGRNKITVSIGEFSSSCNVYVANYVRSNLKVEKKVNMMLSSKTLPLEKCGKASIEYVYVEAKNLDNDCHLLLAYPKNESLFVSAPIKTHVNSGTYTFSIYVAGKPSKKTDISVYLKCGNKVLAENEFSVLPVNYCGIVNENKKRENLKNNLSVFVLIFFIAIMIIVLSLFLTYKRKNVNETIKGDNNKDKKGKGCGQSDIIFASYDQVIE